MSVLLIRFDIQFSRWGNVFLIKHLTDNSLSKTFLDVHLGASLVPIRKIALSGALLKTVQWNRLTILPLINKCSSSIPDIIESSTISVVLLRHLISSPSFHSESFCSFRFCWLFWKRLKIVFLLTGLQHWFHFLSRWISSFITWLLFTVTVLCSSFSVLLLSEFFSCYCCTICCWLILSNFLTDGNS